MGFGLSFRLRRGHYGPLGCVSGEARLRRTSRTQQPRGCWAGHMPPSADVSVLCCVAVHWGCGQGLALCPVLMVVWLVGPNRFVSRNSPGGPKPPVSEHGKGGADVPSKLVLSGQSVDDRVIPQQNVIAYR